MTYDLLTCLFIIILFILYGIEIIFYRNLNVNKKRRNEGQIGRSDESKKNKEGENKTKECKS